MSVTLTTLGVGQWFHYQAYQDVERAVEELKVLGVRHLRTGISWADFHRPEGRQWYDWQMRQLEGFEVLLSVWHTPPSIAEGSACASPPRCLADYGDFIGQVIDLYGHQFADLELWNEPNNLYKWDFAQFDPQWRKFGEMIRAAGEVAQQRGKRTVLGGMIPVDPAWLRLMEDYGALEHIDVVAIHAFPGMWWDDRPICWEWQEQWRGWSAKVDGIRAHTGGRPIWVTETGRATWDLERGCRAFYDDQAKRLRAAAGCRAERVYWYSLIDLDPARSAIEGFHVDENEYHMGLIEWRGRRKPAWEVMRALLSEPVDLRRTLP